MARLPTPFHVPPFGPLTSEPLVEFEELYDPTVPGRWDVNDWARFNAHNPTHHPYRVLAVTCARHWHKEDQQQRTEREGHKRGPKMKFADNAPPNETPAERAKRRNREAQNRWRAKNGLPPLGTAPRGRPPGPKAVAKRTWSEAQAVALAHAAGFAGTYWHMGPEELVHLLNLAAAPVPTDPA